MEHPPIITPEESILQELESQRPNHAPTLLSRAERHLAVERGFLGLYRWYTARSQETRNWHPDLTFDWRNYRQDHSDDIHQIVEGFFAVEQYVPDYVTSLLRLIRRSHGRSHFHMRWGSEEEKHADMWHNAVQFGGRRSREWLEDYMFALRGQEWKLPWDDPMHICFYTVFQERATQVNYLNLGLVAKGESPLEAYKNDEDPVLAHAARVIAIDEAAHYNFFLEGARLFLYYFPEEAVSAMVDIIRHFSMPAGDIIPDYAQLTEALHRTTIFGPRQHYRDVVKVALKNLGGEGLKAVEDGIRRSREVPMEDGQMRTTAIFDSLDYESIETKVQQLIGRVNQHEAKFGLDKIAPTEFVPNPDIEAWRNQRG